MARVDHHPGHIAADAGRGRWGLLPGALPRHPTWRANPCRRKRLRVGPWHHSRVVCDGAMAFLADLRHPGRASGCRPRRPADGRHRPQVVREEAGPGDGAGVHGDGLCSAPAPLHRRQRRGGLRLADDVRAAGRNRRAHPGGAAGAPHQDAPGGRGPAHGRRLGEHGGGGPRPRRRLQPDGRRGLPHDSRSGCWWARLSSAASRPPPTR